MDSITMKTVDGREITFHPPNAERRGILIEVGRACPSGAMLTTDFISIHLADIPTAVMSYWFKELNRMQYH